jgi:hypothetical protein
MKRSIGLRWLLGGLLASSLTLFGCKKDEDPATVPIPSGAASSAPAATTPPPAAADADAGSDAGTGAPQASGASTAATPQPLATTTAPAKQESIDACCTALKAIQKSGKSAIAKSKAASAAAVCPGIAKLVKAGTTGRAAGLSQIRSALTGFDVPGECR